MDTSSIKRRLAELRGERAETEEALRRLRRAPAARGRPEHSRAHNTVADNAVVDATGAQAEGRARSTAFMRLANAVSAPRQAAESITGKRRHVEATDAPSGSRPRTDDDSSLAVVQAEPPAKPDGDHATLDENAVKSLGKLDTTDMSVNATRDANNNAVEPAGVSTTTTTADSATASHSADQAATAEVRSAAAAKDTSDATAVATQVDAASADNTVSVPSAAATGEEKQLTQQRPNRPAAPVDAALMQRSKRLFNSLVGHLGRAKREAEAAPAKQLLERQRHVQDVAVARAATAAAAEAAAARELRDRQLAAANAARLAEEESLRQKRAALEIEEAILLAELAVEVVEVHNAALDAAAERFLLTDAKPGLWWRPTQTVRRDRDDLRAQVKARAAASAAAREERRARITALRGNDRSSDVRRSPRQHAPVDTRATAGAVPVDDVRRAGESGSRRPDVESTRGRRDEQRRGQNIEQPPLHRQRRSRSSSSDRPSRDRRRSGDIPGRWHRDGQSRDDPRSGVHRPAFPPSAGPVESRSRARSPSPRGHYQPPRRQSVRNDSPPRRRSRSPAHGHVDRSPARHRLSPRRPRSRSPLPMHSRPRHPRSRSRSPHYRVIDDRRTTERADSDRRISAGAVVPRADRDAHFTEADGTHHARDHDDKKDAQASTGSPSQLAGMPDVLAENTGGIANISSFPLDYT